MTTPNQPNHQEPEDSDVDATFAEMISSMPELSQIAPPESDDGLVDVSITVPSPVPGQQPMQMVLQVPASVAPALQAEFSPDRIAAMMQAFTTLAGFDMPPPHA